MKTALMLIACLGLNIAWAAPVDDFVTTWKTDNPGTSIDTSITVPMVGGPYDVDWDNDGAFDEFGLSGPVTHDYGITGTYTVRIRGAYDSIRFDNGGDKEKILSLVQWGTQSWTSMERAFFGATNLTVPATDTPDFSAVADMAAMFAVATSANPDTSGWDTSAVTYMYSMFNGATSANPDTSAWDTGAVTDMGWMFNGATSANPDTSAWDTGAVTHMDGMFDGATLANPDTSGWDTSAVTYMYVMFDGATSANPDTSAWDTGAVTDMSLIFARATLANPDTSGWDTSAVTSMYVMFARATSANPDTSAWDTGAVTDMDGMFDGATSFDQDIGSWDVASLINAPAMFRGVTLSKANYESLLIGWDAQALQAGVIFSGGNSMYCSAAAVAARNNMIASDSWDITDGGQCSEIIFYDGFEDGMLPPECPCWDEIELTSVTAANHDDTFSCDTNSSFPLSAQIQNTDFFFPVVEGGFSAANDGANTSCGTRDFEPFNLQITTDEASECIAQIAARCAAIGHPITNPD